MTLGTGTGVKSVPAIRQTAAAYEPTALPQVDACAGEGAARSVVVLVNLRGRREWGRVNSWGVVISLGSASDQGTDNQLLIRGETDKQSG